MNAAVRARGSQHRALLRDGWELARAATPGADPTGSAALSWMPAVVPGTVAASLRARGLWSIDGAARAFDSEEWWYRCRFDTPAPQPGERLILGLEGLATLADIFLNGQLLAASTNMFVAHEIDISALARTSNELLIRFAPLDRFLARKRPRPRWRTPMVMHPQLRWVRTTLLGRTPGWSPPAAAVGPWRPVWVERRSGPDLTDLRLAAGLEGGSGVLDFRVSADLHGSAVHSAVLSVTRQDHSFQCPLRIETGEAGTVLSGQLRIAHIEPWWPHTHGEPALYEVRLRLGTLLNSDTTLDIDIGRVGFRTVSLDRTNGDFALHVNGQPIFCRGAVWTPLDCVSLSASAAQHTEALQQVSAAGFNMLRVAGTNVYEEAAFLDACDEAGVLVWQDFMFANMDYPGEDPDFLGSVRTEAAQMLQQMQGRACLALLCGNSEVYQQAAMSAAPRERWSADLFEKTLAALAAEHCPGIPYCPSSTHGGDYPFSTNQGVTSYYGVGAYLRPLEDARLSELRFASECLAFANVPESETLAAPGGSPLHYNQPRWKERAPRDLGAGWDFDDVRDHYLHRLLRLEVSALRYTDQDRYLRLSRAVTGEVMARTFSEWRRARSSCRGALILFLRDLWPGAGWGVIDATGLPKAPYYYLKRVLQELALFVSDEGSNGLQLHLANDSADPVRGQLQVELYRQSQPVGRPVVRPVTVPGRGMLDLNATQLFDGFMDLSWYYRFGPAAYDVLRAVLIREDGRPDAEAFHFPTGLPNTQSDVGLQARARVVDGKVLVEVDAQRFAHGVHIEAAGYVADDQYFHLAPRTRREICLQPRHPAVEPFEGTVHSLNGVTPQRIDLVP